MLLQDLRERTQKHLVQGQKLAQLSPEQLNHRPGPEKWSILECLEHLNLYGDFYLKEIESRMLKAGNDPNSTVFKTGLLGNYFAKMMLPKKGLIANPMKTFKDKNPIHSNLPITAVDRFIKQQKRMLQLLEMAEMVNLTTIKTNISISKWIKLRLGDTLRVVIYHNERHLLQANNVLASIG